MSLFTSDREKLLWVWVLVVVGAIYATLGLAGLLAQTLRAHNLLNAAFILGFLLAIAAIAGSGLKKQPGRREWWVAIGIAAVYGLVLVRLFVSIEERTHLFEYGIVAALIYQALTERQGNGRRVPQPAVLAMVMTALFGWLDEGIQAVLPNRVYDIRDVGFNAFAGVMAVVARLVMARIQRRGG